MNNAANNRSFRGAGLTPSEERALLIADMAPKAATEIDEEFVMSHKDQDGYISFWVQGICRWDSEPMVCIGYYNGFSDRVTVTAARSMWKALLLDGWTRDMEEEAARAILAMTP